VSKETADVWDVTQCNLAHNVKISKKPAVSIFNIISNQKMEATVPSKTLVPTYLPNYMCYMAEDILRIITHNMNTSSASILRQWIVMRRRKLF